MPKPGKKRESRAQVEDSDSDNNNNGGERRVGVGLKTREAPIRDLDDSDDDMLVRRADSPMHMEDGGGNDFERMMARKRAENKRFRKKKDIDVINENDDAIAKMIADMRIAAKEDRDLNIEGKPGINKMKMFSVRRIKFACTNSITKSFVLYLFLNLQNLECRW